MHPAAAYLERIARHDLSDFSPLVVCEQTLGSVNREWRERLLACPSGLFAGHGDKLVCALEGDAAARSRQLGAAAELWRDAGWLTGWRNEQFAAHGEKGELLFELERAAFRPLGLTSRAIHINGLTRLADGEIRMWVGRRSPEKSYEPNRMDNLVGGGVAAGETLRDACLREGWEEAGIDAARLSALEPVCRLLAERPVARGLHREWLYVHDLWLPEGITPCSQDGEFSEHVLLPFAEVEALLLDGRFMIDAALVAIDCLLRHGHWAGQAAPFVRVFAELREAVAGRVEPADALGV